MLAKIANVMGVANKVPAKTLADRPNADTLAILRTPDVSARLAKLSLDAGATSRSETTLFLAEEAAQWVRGIKEADIEPQ
jgi:tripartite-type tricarboxylate transporter receptor subunit TctC